MEFRQAYDPVRALGGAWQLVVRAPLTLVVGGLLLFLTDPDYPGGVHVEGGRVHWFGAFLAGGVFFFCCCLGLLLWLLNCLLQLGFAGALRRVMNTGEERFSDLFDARGLFGAMVVARVLKLGLVLLISLPFLVMFFGPVVLGRWSDFRIPGVVDSEALGLVIGGVFSLAYLPIWGYVLLGLLLVEAGVAFDGRAPLDALAHSWELARGNRGHLLVYWIAMLVLTALGVCCLVGVLVTGPWCRIAWFESYARLSSSEPATPR